MTITSSRLAYVTGTNTASFTAPSAGEVLYVEARRNQLGDTTSMGLTGYGTPVDSGPGASGSSNERVMFWWKVATGSETSVTFTNMGAGTRAIEVYKFSTSLSGGTWRLIDSQAVNNGSTVASAFTILGFKSPCEENIRFNQWIWSSSITSGETMTQNPSGWTTASVDRFNGGTARINLGQDNLLSLSLTNDLGSARRWSATSATFGYVVLPSIAMTSPAAGSVSGNVTLESNVTGGNVAIERVRFFKAGATQIGSDVLFARQTTENTTTASKHYQVIYLLPSDQTDRRMDGNGSINQGIQNVETFIDGEVSKHFRVGRTAKNVVHVAQFRSSRTKAAYAAGDAYSLIISDLQAAGFNDTTNKNYIVYFEGVDNVGGVLGRSAVASTLSQTGIYVVIYLHSTSASVPMSVGNATKLKGNADTETYWPDTSLVHELFHSLGAVQTAAPNDDGSYHLNPTESTSHDIMGGNQPDRVIDFNNDDYYGHSGGWLDTADSTLLMTPQEFVVGDWQGYRFAYWNTDAEAAGTYSVTSRLYVRDLGDQITSAAVSYTKSGAPSAPTTGFKKRNASGTNWNSTVTKKRTGSNTWV